MSPTATSHPTSGVVSVAVPARAALAGNPSDGHGGAVVATVVPSVAATVTARVTDRFELGGGWSHGSIGELRNRLDAGARHDGARHDGERQDGEQSLVAAALITLHRHLGAEPAPVRVDVHSTIPRSVGLAGSSAIVIAAMRAVAELHPTEPWGRSLSDPELLASLALAAERDVLGIAAGLQDRVVQSFGGTVAMEFGDAAMHRIAGLEVGTYRPLGALPDGLFVAYRPDTAGDSGAVHGAVDPTDAAVKAAMQRAAVAARTAAAAIDAGDACALGAAMDQTFDQRAAVMDLDHRHVEMVEVARANGASANYTGSGGAVVVLADDDRAVRALERNGCRILTLCA